MRTGFAWLLICLLSTGCALVDVGVTNPIPEMTTVAVVPSFNLSQERSVDGRRFALAYYSELQKVPGFTVIPVGVVETAIHEAHLQMNDERDALRLCEILEADAVVIGSVTDYNPYYPPRIGMQVSWYSPKSWVFHPGVPTEPERDGIFDDFDMDLFDGKGPFNKKSCHCQCDESIEGDDSPPGKKRKSFLGPMIIGLKNSKEPGTRTPGSSNEPNAGADPVAEESGTDGRESPGLAETVEGAGSASAEMHNGEQAVTPIPTTIDQQSTDSVQSAGDTPSVSANQPSAAMDGHANPDRHAPVDAAFLRNEHPLPIMSYTRMFDGADALVTARLRDYVELSGNLRSGGWEAYLHRSEDYIRFTAHVMIIEMLTLHGGETRQRIVFKHRKYK